MNIWIQGARPRTLPAAIAPVVVATVLAGSHWKPLQALLALFVSLALQVAVNFSNDYSDGIRGTDDNRVGPIRITASKLASAESVKRAAIISFALASLAGLILAYLSSYWIIAIGVAAIAAAWGYTGGKNPYGYKGLGEMSVFVFFGVVATMGTYYVQTLDITWNAFAASVPMGSLSCALLAINNLRDREQDQLVGKRTLAVRIGDRGSRVFFVSLIASAYIFAFLAGSAWTLLTLLTLPLSLPLARTVLKGASRAELVPLLGATGKLQLAFAIIFAASLAL
ncbi:MAG: 1,4-dihydroxy-2-naphthoate polyprenyltransferase [Actinobacteria bacterium]|nr:1,4-dihydroxy-2-naphthoate polyprenyltransferase [Actinomycetota bacterium]